MDWAGIFFKYVLSVTGFLFSFSFHPFCTLKSFRPSSCHFTFHTSVLIQQSQQTNIHAPGGIRNHNPRKRATTDPRLRPCSHWNRQRYRTRASAVRGRLLTAWAMARPSFRLCVVVLRLHLNPFVFSLTSIISYSTHVCRSGLFCITHVNRPVLAQRSFVQASFIVATHRWPSAFTHFDNPAPNEEPCSQILSSAQSRLSRDHWKGFIHLSGTSTWMYRICGLCRRREVCGLPEP
jgi:hypothetical protein